MKTWYRALRLYNAKETIKKFHCVINWEHGPGRLVLLMRLDPHRLSMDDGSLFRWSVARLYPFIHAAADWLRPIAAVLAHIFATVRYCKIVCNIMCLWC